MGKLTFISKLALTMLSLLSSCNKELIRSEATELFNFSKELITPNKEGEIKRLVGSITYNGEEVLEKIAVVARLTHYAFEEPYEYSYKVVSPYYYSVKKGDIIDYDFEVSDSDLYAKYKILINLNIYDAFNFKYLDSRNLYLYEEEHQEINPDDYRISPLIIDKLTYQDGSIFEERYLFDGIKNENNLPYYLRFDASIFSLTYQADIPFNLANAYISFIDTNNYYPHIVNVNGYKHLPLIYKQEDDLVTFYLDNLYILPSTLDMSSFPLDGYIKTNYLYFPRNQITELQGYTFYINLENMGANGIAVHHEVMLKTSRLFIGPCNDAVYCVVGGVA